MMNKRFMKAVIDREVPLDKLLVRLLGDSRRSYEVGRSCYCPFHDNHDTPAAKLYDDERGITLFCFTEQKSYRSSDAFLAFTNAKLEDIFNKIWNRLSEEEKAFYMDKMDAGDAVISEAAQSFLNSLEPFRRGEMTYDDVLESILNSTIVGTTK